MRHDKGGKSRAWWAGAVLVFSGAVLLAFRWPMLWSLPAPEPLSKGRINTAIPASYFGMTVNSIGLRQPWPKVNFNGVRLWGAIYWAQINPAAGVYNWRRFDDILDLTQKHQVDVIFNLAFTPRWAAATKQAPPSWIPGASSPPADLAIWDEWVRSAVTRAAGRIRFWEIWNEPEDQDFYSGDMATLVEMQKRAYRIIKEIDPSLVVLTPSSNGTPTGLRWQTEFIAQGGATFADVFAFHGYAVKPEEIVGTIGQLKGLLSQHGLADKPLWDTEAGWRSSLDAQADYLARAYILNWIYGVDRFYWYEYEGGGSDYGRLWQGGRLLPGGIAYQTIYGWLLGARVLSVARPTDSLWVVELRLADGAAGVIVWNATGSSAYQVEGAYSRLQQLDGMETGVGRGTIMVGTKPILLRTGQGK